MSIHDAIFAVLTSPITGLVLAVGSIWLTFYLDRRNRTVRRMAFHVGPVGLRNWGPVADRPVAAVTIAIWNAGTTEIRKDDITVPEPLTVRVVDGSSIFRARVRAMSRPANGVYIQTAPSLGMFVKAFTIAFEYLNPGDGAVLEVLYVGQYDADLAVEGALVGVGSPVRLGSSLARVLKVFLISEALWIIGAASWRSGGDWYASALIVAGALLYPLYVLFFHASYEQSRVPTKLANEMTPPPLLEAPPRVP